MGKQIGIWVGIIVLILGFVWGLILLSNSSTTPPVPQAQQNSKLPTVSSTDLSTGPKNTKVTIIEYADFQCPGCGYEYPVLKKITTDYNSKLLFVYRTFPLTQIHKNAMESAEYAIAANQQGKFWEMHDKLFETQNVWANVSNPTAIFDGYAKNLGLNMVQLKKDVADKSTANFISSEEQAGINAGVNSTPTLFINSKQIQITDHLPSYDELKKLIDQQLAAK